VVVVDCGVTGRLTAAQAVERITHVGGKVLGLGLNRVGPRADGYHTIAATIATNTAGGATHAAQRSAGGRAASAE